MHSLAVWKVVDWRDLQVVEPGGAAAVLSKDQADGADVGRRRAVNLDLQLGPVAGAGQVLRADIGESLRVVEGRPAEGQKRASALDGLRLRKYRHPESGRGRPVLRPGTVAFTVHQPLAGPGRILGDLQTALARAALGPAPVGAVATRQPGPGVGWPGAGPGESQPLLEARRSLVERQLGETKVLYWRRGSSPGQEITRPFARAQADAEARRGRWGGVELVAAVTS